MSYQFTPPPQDMYSGLVSQKIPKPRTGKLCQRYMVESTRMAVVRLFDILDTSNTTSHNHNIVFVSQLKWNAKKAAVLRYCHNFVYSVLSNSLSL